jgi:tetratricopeptide (TPR) repeat protein
MSKNNLKPAVSIPEAYAAAAPDKALPSGDPRYVDLSSCRGGENIVKKLCVESGGHIRDYQEKIRRLQQFKALLEDYEKQPFEEAKRYFHQSLKIVERFKDKKLIISIFSNLSFVSAYQGDYISAEEYTEKTSEISQEIEDNKEGMVCYFLVLGVIANAQGNYNKAEEFFKKSLEVGKELGNKELTASALEFLGSLAKAQEKYTEARGFLEQSLKISKEIGVKQLIALTKTSLGEVYLKTEDFSKAERSVLDALEIYESLGASEMIKRVHQYLEQVRKGKQGKNKF